jgi:putative flippase GtrA
LIKNWIIQTIDFFYPLAKRLMPLQTFRYAACGGANMLLGLSLYYVLFNFIFKAQNVSAFVTVLKAHNAALFIAGCITFCVGFLLNKFIVFTSSNLLGKIQLFRYFISFSSNLVINYFLLRLFIERLKLDEFLAQVISTIIIVTISYLTQKYFSFKEQTVQE